MEREELDRLLAEYATGGLGEADRKRLFAAALQDQALFDQLMEEDALREVIEMPGARDRLIDALQEESVPVLMPASVAVPMRAKVFSLEPQRRQSVWLAWAAGIGVVFVSGALSYILLDPGASEKVAQVMPQSQRDVKPFVAPPERPLPPAAKKVVVEPPPVMAEARKSAPLPAVNIPLPAAPPPPPAEQPGKDVAQPVAKSRADAVTVASEAAAVKTEAGPTRNALLAPKVAAPARAARETAAAGAAAPASADLASAQPAAAAWRRSGDGVWVRLTPDESVGREDAIVIRYTPLRNGPVTLADANGRTLVRRDGRGGEELELAVPRAALDRAQGGEVTLSVNAGAVPAKIVLRIR